MGRESPLPAKAMTVVIFVAFSESFQNVVLFPFVAFMVASFQVQEDMIGVYSGLVAAAFPLGQLCSSFFFGKLSDRFGAKPCVIFSLLFNAICALLFGFSQNVPWAFLVRFATGLCNGNIGIIKSYMGKVTDATNQAQAMSLFSAAGAIGAISGPIIGGYLADPVAQYPDMFSSDGLFARFRYLLPCIFSVCMSTFGCIVCSIVMKEASVVLQEIEEAKRKRKRRHDDEEPELSIFARLWYALPLPVAWKGRPARPLVHLGDLEESDEELIDEASDAVVQSDRTGIDEDILIFDYFVYDDGDHNTNDDSSVVGASDPVHYQPYSLRLVWFCAAMYGSVAFLFIIVDEIFPLFCREKLENGGLGFTSSQIGTALSVLGMFSISYNILIFRRISKYFGLLRIFRFSILLAAPLCMIYPFITYIGDLDIEWLLWVVLLLNHCLLRGAVGLNCFTTVMIFINNSVPRENMGVANGIGQSWAAAVRAAGPAFGGIIWSLTATSDFPLHAFIIWMFCVTVCVITFSLTFLYPPTIQKPFVKIPLDDDVNMQDHSDDQELTTLNHHPNYHRDDGMNLKSRLLDDDPIIQNDNDEVVDHRLLRLQDDE